MLSKINCFDIFTAHIETFKPYNPDGKKNDKKSTSDFVLFFAFPIVVAAVGLKIVPTLSKDLVNVLVTAFSVFAALLFNLLLLIFDIIRRSKDNPATQIIKMDLLKEIHANISYSILISIASIIVLLVPLLNIDIPGISLTWGYSDKVVSFIIYFLIGHFILTLLMILNRVHVLLSHESNS